MSKVSCPSQPLYEGDLFICYLECRLFLYDRRKMKRDMPPYLNCIAIQSRLQDLTWRMFKNYFNSTSYVTQLLQDFIYYYVWCDLKTNIIRIVVTSCDIFN